ncbi:MAG TPA: ferredoxin [Acidimicrobiales bacterium]|nr:ferredoxin [Acidimicrobiales bacterium]
MRVVVDFNRCINSGSCTRSAPTVFQIRHDQLDVLQEEPPEELRAEVEEAADYCPTAAIRIEG